MSFVVKDGFPSKTEICINVTGVKWRTRLRPGRWAGSLFVECYQLTKGLGGKEGKQVFGQFRVVGFVRNLRSVYDFPSICPSGGDKTIYSKRNLYLTHSMGWTGLCPRPAWRGRRKEAHNQEVRIGAGPSYIEVPISCNQEMMCLVKYEQLYSP